MLCNLVHLEAAEPGDFCITMGSAKYTHSDNNSGSENVAEILLKRDVPNHFMLVRLLFR
jgi:hypothetical protein